MPFQPQNRRYTVLVVAITFVMMLALMSIVTVYMRGQKDSTPIIATIIGFVAITLNQLIGQLRVEQSAEEVIKTRHDLKNEMQANRSQTEVIAQVVEQKQQATTAEIDGKLEAAIEKAVAKAVAEMEKRK